MTFGEELGLADGRTPELVAAALAASGVDALGVNCGIGPSSSLDALGRMDPARHGLPGSFMPNAGLPKRIEGQFVYAADAAWFGEVVPLALAAGARIIGGCCGTTPEHIKLLRNEARSLQPGHKQLEVTVEEPAVAAQALPEVPIAEKSTLGAKLALGKFVSFVEILPARGVNAAKELAGAKMCAERGIDCINVPDGPRASARMSAQVTCQLIQQHAGIEAVLHFCCRDRNILGIQSELLGAHAAGIRNLICITGDPPRMGAYPAATAVFDVDAIGLVNIVHNLNRGLDIGGNPMGSQTSLLIGVGANPGALNFDEEMRRFEWKVRGGAEFVVTQPVFDIDLLERFVRRAAPFRIPVLAGIWPMLSHRNAEFMVNELNVPVPAEFMERMRRADTTEKARREGVAIAREMLGRIGNLVAGVQLSAPFGRYEMALEVAEALPSR
jgi:homocysteine S-methyltransferase